MADVWVCGVFLPLFLEDGRWIGVLISAVRSITPTAVNVAARGSSR